ncbi:hypothetical protein EJB05_14707, partial [Eragrostis curvula]
MVNWVQVANKQLVHRLARAGLRRHTVDVDDAGTVMTIWVPKHKLPTADEEQRRKKNEQRGCRLPVVLLHGFAGDGILTWVLQIGALAKHYDVYVPDLLFFGGSTSPAPGRSPEFQAECVVAALRKLGVKRCAVVGFSYGGFVAFRMAEEHPGLVRSVVVTGSLAAMTASTSDAVLQRLGAASWVDILLPGDVAGVRSLFAVGTHGKWWLPDRVLKDYLDSDRAELLQGMVISDKDTAAVPSFRQDILLLWGEGDMIFNMELADFMTNISQANLGIKELGEKATLRSISKAGHLAQLERPHVFSRCLLEFLQRGEVADVYHDDVGVVK